MAPQEIFDYVAKHLRSMPRRYAVSDTPTAVCLYLSPDGNRCAVGALFPLMDLNPFTRRALETATIDVFGIAERYSPPKWFKDASVLLQHLQQVHDLYDSWGEQGFNQEGETRLESVAKQFKLTYSPPIIAKLIAWHLSRKSAQ